MKGYVEVIPKDLDKYQYISVGSETRLVFFFLLIHVNIIFKLYQFLNIWPKVRFVCVLTCLKTKFVSGSFFFF